MILPYNIFFSELKAQYSGKKIKISSDLFAKGCVQTAEQGLAAAQKIGFPVMIKASEGGGGKGIRKVENADEFPTAFRQVNFHWFLQCFIEKKQTVTIFLFIVFVCF